MVVVLQCYTIPAEEPRGMVYRDYADWMADSRELTGPWRAHLRAALFGASLPDEAPSV